MTVLLLQTPRFIQCVSRTGEIKAILWPFTSRRNIAVAVTANNHSVDQLLKKCSLNNNNNNFSAFHNLKLDTQKRRVRCFGSDESNSGKEKIVYIHPLSQIVLSHLQDCRGDWITSNGLSTGLTIESDGTFTLQFQHGKGKVWTSFDPEEKKHWLMVQKGDLEGRYLLQDNMKPAWHSDKRSTPEKVQDAVDEMIRKLSSN